MENQRTEGPGWSSNAYLIADHVVLDEYRRLGARICARPLTAAMVPGVVDTEVAEGDVLDPEATGIADLRRSLERLSALPATTRVHPGHRESTTIGAELAANPSLRALLDGRKPEGVTCAVAGEASGLLLWGPDYDGTNKAWVRFEVDGGEAIVGGSQVER